MEKNRETYGRNAGNMWDHDEHLLTFLIVIFLDETADFFKNISFGRFVPAEGVTDNGVIAFLKALVFVSNRRRLVRFEVFEAGKNQIRALHHGNGHDLVL